MTAAGPRGLLAVVVPVNLAARFAAELASSSALAYFGTRLGLPVGLRVLCAVLLPFAAVVLWSLFLSPTALRPLADPAAIVCEVAVFAGAAAALGCAGLVLPAVVLRAVGCGNALALRWLGLRQQALT